VAGNTAGVTMLAGRIPGMINWTTEQLIGRWKNKFQTGMRKWERKYALSCRPIRICFGDANFFERATSLVIVGFQFEHTASLILIAGK